MKKTINLLMLLPVFCTFACGPKIEGGHENITFVNKSAEEVAIQLIWQIKISPEDTIFDGMVGSRFVLPDSSIQEGSVNECWEMDFTAVPYIQYLVMDGSLMHKYREYAYTSSDTIRKYVPVIQRYQLTLQDLERLNYVVTYPPTEEMKNVKMYPPYKTRLDN